MIDIGYYMNLSYDLSGSMSKNRFRYELLWGLRKMLYLFKQEKEFTVVFDYVCDIEVHLDTHFEFYQLKTQNKNSYTIDKPTKIKDKTKSILGNLYLLKYDENMIEKDKTCIYVVSNVPLKGNKLYTDSEIINLDDIDKGSKDILKQRLKSELKLSEDINLKNTYFIRTSMNLIDPSKEIIGEISIFFEEVFGEECKRTNSLYRILAEEVLSKGCYELKTNDYEELIEKKGFTRDRLEKILNKFVDKNDDSLNMVKKSIEDITKNDFSKKIKLKLALSNILINLPKSKDLQSIENDIVIYIHENLDKLNKTEKEIIEIIMKTIEHKKTIEISNEEMEILILLTLKKYEEGVYE